MKAHTRQAVMLGDLVAAVFDEAAQYNSDPREVSRIAAMVVHRILRRAGLNRRLSDPHNRHTLWSRRHSGGVRN